MKPGRVRVPDAGQALSTVYQRALYTDTAGSFLKKGAQSLWTQFLQTQFFGFRLYHLFIDPSE